MEEHPGWYPPGRVCHPPTLPTYLQNVCDLKPIVGVPSDADVIGIHAVIQAANRVSGIPGMHDPKFLMGLADHLFGAQMAKYRSKYSLITFPSDAMYAPPGLPAHIAVHLEPVFGAPSDDDLMRAEEAVRSYQQFSHAPSMFDTRVNMELSQHLFNLQMARYMRRSAEIQQSPMPQTTTGPAGRGPVLVERVELENATGLPIDATNNLGTGANATVTRQPPQLAPTIDIRELMERSNQLAERFNQLLERSNELAEQHIQPADPSNSQTITERFNLVLERLTQLIERSHQTAEQPDRLAQRFNSLFESFNQLAEQSTQPALKANELAEQLNQSSKRSNQLAEQANKSWERMGDVLGNINKVLVKVQHAIVRNHKGNKISALDCLVNERGETPAVSSITNTVNFWWLLENQGKADENRLPIVIDGIRQDAFISDGRLGRFLRFYGINDEKLFGNTTSETIKPGMEAGARERLREYLSACLG